MDENDERHRTERPLARKPRPAPIRFDAPSVLLGLEPDSMRVLCWHIFSTSAEQHERAYAFCERLLDALDPVRP